VAAIWTIAIKVLAAILDNLTVQYSNFLVHKIQNSVFKFLVHNFLIVFKFIIHNIQVQIYDCDSESKSPVTTAPAAAGVSEYTGCQLLLSVKSQHKPLKAMKSLL
jgi:hypothetical protein